ncbi:unnamed protein product, partial [Hapterophycus canaliculatus]
SGGRQCRGAFPSCVVCCCGLLSRAGGGRFSLCFAAFACLGKRKADEKVAREGRKCCDLLLAREIALRRHRVRRVWEERGEGARAFFPFLEGNQRCSCGIPCSVLTVLSLECLLCLPSFPKL